MKTGFSFVINSKLLASVDPNNWKDLPHYRTGHCCNVQLSVLGW